MMIKRINIIFKRLFYFKYYRILNIWKGLLFYEIIINRMLGLILSVLIFANIIYYMKYVLNCNILIIIYIYLLIISICSELI